MAYDIVTSTPDCSALPPDGTRQRRILDAIQAMTSRDEDGDDHWATLQALTVHFYKAPGWEDLAEAAVSRRLSRAVDHLFRKGLLTRRNDGTRPGKWRRSDFCRRLEREEANSNELRRLGALMKMLASPDPAPEA